MLLPVKSLWYCVYKCCVFQWRLVECQWLIPVIWATDQSSSGTRWLSTARWATFIDVSPLRRSPHSAVKSIQYSTITFSSWDLLSAAPSTHCVVLTSYQNFVSVASLQWLNNLGSVRASQETYFRLTCRAWCQLSDGITRWRMELRFWSR